MNIGEEELQRRSSGNRLGVVDIATRGIVRQGHGELPL